MFIDLLKRYPAWILPALAVMWWLVYGQLQDWSIALVTQLGIAPETPLFDALSFFFYDVPKILLLLLAITFVMGVVNSYLDRKSTRLNSSH